MLNPVDCVNPLIDTAERRFFFLTTASRPFGMVNLSPDTRAEANAWKSGYRYDDKHIRWFSHVHAWQLCALPIMPTMGDFKGHLGADEYKSAFSHDKETAKPGYHSVYLEDYAVKAELTATVRAGFHRYTFEQAGLASIVMDIAATIMLPMSDCFAQIINKREISGYVENERTPRRPKRTKIFYFVRFDRDFDDHQAWQAGKLIDEQTVLGNGAGIAPQFKVDAGDCIQLQVGISYCSVGQAKLNLDTEMATWDFDQIKCEAMDEWNQWLSRVQVEGGTEKQKIKFYTDLFHAIKGRRRVSDVNGKYLDNTGDHPVIRQIPLDEHNKPKYDHHNSDAFWGAPWSLNLLWALVWPEVTSNFCNTLVDMYKNGGLIPRGPSGGNYTYVMSSPTSTTFLVSAWMQGIRDFDIEAAYEGMLKNHGPGGMMSKCGYEHYTSVGGGVEYYLERGYVPLGIKTTGLHSHAAGTFTLEYAYHDWALAQLADKLGKNDDYKMLMRRSKNYINIWDKETKHMRPRNMDGSFIENFGLFDKLGWEEGNATKYRWYVPHDVDGLAELMGGKETFVAELDNLLKEAEKTQFIAPHGEHHTMPLDYGNQPSTYIAHLFSHAGAPWLSHKWVRKIVNSEPKSNTTPYGGYGGDEDQGMMGCLNALMSIGLFNVQGGCCQEPILELTPPIFDKVTIHLSKKYFNANIFTIIAENNGDGVRYIDSAQLNGEEIKTPWVKQKDVVEGGTITMQLSDKPNKTWGIPNEDITESK